MRLVSLNAWGGREWGALSAWLPAVGADVFCLQEVIRAPEISPDWLEYIDQDRRLDQRPNLLRDVSARLPDHEVWFAAAARGPLYEGKRAFESEHGIACWVARHLAVTGARHDFVHGSFRPDGWGTDPKPRAIQGARVFDPESGRSVLIVHFHGLRDPGGKGDTPARRSQGDAVLRFLSEMRGADEPTVLAGDFNILPDNPMFAALEEIGLTELVTSRGHTDTRTSHYAKSQRYADYLLVSGEVRVRAFDAPATPEVSDHRPLILDFDLT